MDTLPHIQIMSGRGCIQTHTYTQTYILGNVPREGGVRGPEIQGRRSLDLSELVLPNVCATFNK